MKFINFRVVKLSICIVVGILLANLYQGKLFFGFWILLSLLPILFTTWFIAKKQFIQNSFFGIVSYLCFIFLGSFIYQIQQPQFQDNHFSNFTSKYSSQNLQIKVSEILKSDTYNSKYIAKVISINQQKSQGKILLSVKKDSCKSSLLIDDSVLVYGAISEINRPLNPHQFDYSLYMKKLGVHQQIRIEKSQILKKEKGNFTLKGKAEQVRTFIIDKLNKTPLQKKELSIIQALILGQRRDISKQLYSDYTAAGAIHILAVSGLHVGVFYFIIGFLLTPIERFRKGKAVKSIVIVLCLWLFAMIAGLSPSVVRAVTMFSFFAFATLLEREANTINTLFNSFFILLLIKPMWLFHVGFQLSYLAVFFILWLQPKLYKYYKPKFYLDRLFWSIITVTIAVQIGIIPLSIFYFHQLPSLSILTNLVVLPFLGILLGLGILVIVLTVLDLLPDWLATSYNYLIKILNDFISWIAGQEGFLHQNIHFPLEKMIGWYLLIIACILLWKKINYPRIVSVLLSLSILLSVYIWNEIETSKNQFIVFQKSRYTIIGSKFGEKLQLFRSDTATNYFSKFPIKGYITSQDIVGFFEKKIPQIMEFKHKKIIIIDSLGVYPNSTEIDIVLLSSSPKVNLERMIDSLQPQLIIADGNNYKTYVQRWKETCEKKQIPFHNTNVNGAFILE